MKKCRCIIIDDEVLARDVIRNLLIDESSMTIVDEASNGTEAVMKILQHRPDLLFLDIQMPGFDGFEVIKEIWPHHQPHIVFTTAYDQYALRAFEVCASDYLLKPFDYTRFYQALDRIKKRILDQNHLQVNELIGKLLQMHASEKEDIFLQRLIAKENNRMILIKTEEITHLCADGNYISLFTTGSKKHVIFESLSSLETKLNPVNFMRVSRSCMVNINFILELESYFNGEYILHLSGGKTVKCTRGYRDNMKSYLSKLK
ncbi:LytR/AlgR family response regulator transcription factor [Dyadobacter tibetensis]|uniref:LytR/AlgR family response regulator transcription factor n=1 Tax=Dyadobacter tibetensis TaxID=1211851 RepID=UPI0004729B2B|nr:LytTR family DNA-binding domain-containing protein [Dyadobacter tibetensis]